MSFKHFLITEKINLLLEKSSIRSAFVANADDESSVLSIAKRKTNDLSKLFMIIGKMKDGTKWYFVYRETEEYDKQTIVKEFEKTFKAFSIGTGADSFTKIETKDLGA